MPRARANGIEIEYETFGPEDAPPLLLVMGLGGQLLLWPEPVCEGLAGRVMQTLHATKEDLR